MEEKFWNSARNCLIITCCCTFGVFILGVNRLSAQMFVPCMVRYNVGRKEAAFPFSLAITMRCVFGPLVGYLGRKFGVEEVVLVGCVLSVVGVGACFFAEDIIAVTVFWGCLYGLGFGLGITLVPEILRTYFFRHYDKANGIFFASSSISGVFIILIIEYLLKTYGTSGTFLVTSGLMMHCIVAGIILLNFKRRRNVFEVKRPTTIDNHTDSSKTSQDNKLSLKPLENLKEIPNTSHEDMELCKVYTKSEADSNGRVAETEMAMTVPSEVGKIPEKVRKENELLKIILMFLDPTFIIISISQCITTFTISTFWTTIRDYSRDVGVPNDHEVSIIMGFTVVDIIGKLTLGCITDSGHISKKNFAVLFHFLVGISLWSLSVVHGFILTMASVCAIGFFTGGEIMISSGIVVMYIEKDKVLLAFGCRFFLFPLFGFAQPYIIEYFRDILGSYNGLFYFLTVLNAISGFLIMLLPLTTRFREKRRKVLEKSRERIFQ